MCECVHVCMRVYMYVSRVYVLVCPYAHVDTYVHTREHVCVCTRISVRVCVYV